MRKGAPQPPPRPQPPQIPANPTRFRSGTLGRQTALRPARPGLKERGVSPHPAASRCLRTEGASAEAKPPRRLTLAGLWHLSSPRGQNPRVKVVLAPGVSLALRSFLRQGGDGGRGAAAQMCNHIWIQWRPGVSGPHLTEAHPEAQRAESARSLCSQTFPGILEQSQRGKSQPPGENAQGGCIASGPAYVSPTPAVQGRGQFLATLVSPHACHHGVEDKKAFADLQRLQRIQGGQWPWWQHKGMGGKKSLPNLVYQ